MDQDGYRARDQFRKIQLDTLAERFTTLDRAFIATEFQNSDYDYEITVKTLLLFAPDEQQTDKQMEEDKAEAEGDDSVPHHVFLSDKIHEENSEDEEDVCSYLHYIHELN